ncbi:MAG TPA: thymidylate kinase [Methanocella sp.]|uniref:thymidylate kinase n=1 Tax=Methanocella sp. TaxID=2052833 RepID=UPI002BAD1433|nr:thymidylate kinase [Methanocella sp.]HTY91710.1 thymidylate kinase [Methanocella sp.]
MMRLYVIDGLDGSGKDTQAYRLKEYLSKDGREVVLRIHPSPDNAFGRISKRSLTKSGQLWRLVATLFYGLDVVRSILLYAHGDRDVIFVRYTLACAYLPQALIRPVYAVVNLILPKSPNMFFLDVSPGEALRRIKARGDSEEMFETLPHLEKNRNRALLILGNWKVVDGNVAPEAVFDQIVKNITP